MGSDNIISRLGQSLWERRHPAWAARTPGVEHPHLDLTLRSLPRYGFDQAVVRARGRGDDRPPWITAESLRLLDDLLRPTDVGIEWGSGGTTPWFAQRIGSLASVEGVRGWHDVLRERLDADGVANVDLFLADGEGGRLGTEEHRRAYVGAHPDLGEGSVDLAFVDGEYREHCMRRAMRMLRSGGLLVLDNATTYLPAETRSPWKVAAPVTELWREVAADLEGWRRIWTTNGVWDTAVWFKP